MFTRICFVAGAVAVAGGHAAAGGADLLEQVREAHRAAVESIRTLHCRVEVVERGSSVVVTTAEYWRQEGDFRCRSKVGTRGGDVTYRSGKLTVLHSEAGHPGGEPQSGFVSNRNDAPIAGDPYAYGLLGFMAVGRYRASLDELLTAEHVVHSVTTESRDGRPLVHLDLSHARGRVSIWFDPAVNHLARVVRNRSKAGDSEAVAEVTAFREAAPGVYFPAKVVSAGPGDGPAEQRPGWTMTVTHLQVNRPLPPDVFNLRLPRNLLVGDQVNEKMWRTDERGEPTIPAKSADGRPLTYVTGRPVEPVGSVLPDDRPTATRLEPQPWSRWLLPAALALVAVGVVLMAVRRLRAG